MEKKTRQEELIKKILIAKSFSDIVGNVDPLRVDDVYKKIAKLIHPDVCRFPDATLAFARMCELKTLFQKGASYEDDAGPFSTNGFSLQYTGERSFLEKSYQNYQLLKTLKDANSAHFHRYLPKEMIWDGKALQLAFLDRSVPLTRLTLPPEHVRWILSRILEFSALMEQYGFVHGGISPESVFVVPETHGIIITSFYHMKRKGTKMDTLSGSYASWYPDSVFSRKKAETVIDLELCKKSATALLGEPSGNPIKLKKTQNAEFIDFLVRLDTSAAKAFTDYRKLLERNFEKKFCPLSL